MNREIIIESAQQCILAEAKSLGMLADSISDAFVAAVEAIIECKGKVIMTGVGKSGLIARKIAATLASTGTPSFFLHPTEAFHGDLGMISREDVVLAMSHSGETDEVLKIIPFIQSNGNTLISISGNGDSTLSKNSHIALCVGVEHEACILNLAPTTSTTSQLAMGDALAVTLMKMRGFTAVDFARLHPGGSLGRRLLMRVESVMRCESLPIVSPECSAKDMIHAISRGGLGLIIVCDEQNRLLGIITDGDIRRSMESHEADFFKIVASDILTPNPKSITADKMLIEAERLMTRHKVNSLIVVDSKKHVTGVVQIYDIKL